MLRRSFSLAILVTLLGCAPRSYEVSCEPVLTCINIIDQNGTSETISNSERLLKYNNVDFLLPQPYQKVMRVYSRDACGNLSSLITSYHPNGVPHQYLEVVNGRAKGAYTEWYPDGTKKIEGYIVGGAADLTAEAIGTWLFDGKNTAWDEEGRLQAELEYSKGCLDGVCTYYHKNGSTWKIVPFLRGKIEGTVEVFLENGELFQKTVYCQGNKDGPSLRYWCGGSIAADECYSGGHLNEGKYFDQQGKLVAEIIEGTGMRAVFGKEAIVELQEYLEGVQNGEVQIFAKNGTIAQSYRTKNGIKHGEEYWWYPGKAGRCSKDKPKLMVSWYEGKIQGVTKTWYANGNQESQREMSNNCKNGLSTAWYEDGSLMLIEEYEKDKLTKGEYYKKGDFVPVSLIINGNGTATLFDVDGSFLRKIEYTRGYPDEGISQS
jgi:antitoxin component YwqK of YwqJK toxin-antitoxin module